MTCPAGSVRIDVRSIVPGGKAMKYYDIDAFMWTNNNVSYQITINLINCILIVADL